MDEFAPPFAKDPYTEQEQHILAPFFTNLDKSVYVPLIFSPEMIGALCSRTSRAADDLRLVFLKEYAQPFLGENDEYGKHLKAFIEFLHEHPTIDMFSNPKARSFYTKWLAQYGDDSIAQMAGMHVVYTGLSQLAIKHFEDQRIGLAPIEKSTRYVNYSVKTNGKYRYYTDPVLKDYGLKEKYEDAMDTLFDTYADLIPKLSVHLAQRFPEETASVVEKKAFDTVRGLLPVSTLSQVAFFGNGQSFEYLMARSLEHSLGEVRWAAHKTREELNAIAPSFLRRTQDDSGKAQAYHQYLAQKSARMKKYASNEVPQTMALAPSVELVEYDKGGEAKVIAGMLYAAEEMHGTWNDALAAAKKMSKKQQKSVIDAYVQGRGQRWQKVGRAFENTYVRFEIAMNIGAWRDLQRHRMLTQMRQQFTCAHGYDTPPELIEAKLDGPYRKAMEGAKSVFEEIAKENTAVAQYAVPMAYRVRFMQYKNIRECFWEMELRTIPEGHPDYRHIEQEKFRLFEKAFPLLSQYMHVNMGEYDFARRGQEEKIQHKLRQLEKMNAQV